MEEFIIWQLTDRSAQPIRPKVVTNDLHPDSAPDVLVSLSMNKERSRRKSLLIGKKPHFTAS